MEDRLLKILNLPEMVRVAVESPELAQLFENSRLSREDLQKEIEPKLDDYLSVEKDSLAAFQKADAELTSANNLRAAQLEHRGQEPTRRELTLNRWMTGVGAVILMAGVVTQQVLQRYGKVWYHSTGIFSPYPTAAAIGLIVAAIAGMWLTFRGLDGFRGWFRRKRIYDSTAVMPQERITALTNEWRALFQQLRQAIFNRGVLVEVRAILNRETAPLYSVHLGKATAMGLSETVSGLEVETRAKREMESLLRLPGASIGLAGARGAGKTTLMNQMAERRIPNSQKQPCSVMCPAPVEYSGRDYLVTLFLLLCNAVLEKHDLESASLSPLEPLNDHGPRWSKWLEVLTRLPLARLRLYLLMGGIMLLYAGGGLVAYDARVQTPPSAAQAGSAGADAGKTAVSGQHTAPAQQTSAKPAPQGVELFRTYLRLAGVEAAALLRWSVWMLVSAGALTLLMRAQRQMHERAMEDKSRSEAERGSLNDTTLAQKARAYRDELRFQQSYTAGWSGALKLPFGLEGGRKDDRTSSRNQRSLPELVTEFKEFLPRVTAVYEPVCICIDELDKLEDDKRAHLFLNEVKAIFGVRNVFYLISVSENAMSAFEQRGLPFRDVFDSSFQAIVYVDYLKLEESKTLLKRRTTRIPEPFLMFCHCMSGGLPRDLIRACRRMLDIASGTGEDELMPLALGMIFSDIQTKARGMSIAVSKLPGDADQTEFLVVLTGLITMTEHELSLLPTARTLFGKADGLRARLLAPAEGAEVVDAERIRQIAALVDMQTEFALYLVYVATVLQIFAEFEGGRVWERAGSAEQRVRATAIDYAVLRCERLASVRQSLAVSPSVGRLRLVALRQSLGLHVDGVEMAQAAALGVTVEAGADSLEGGEWA